MSDLTKAQHVAKIIEHMIHLDQGSLLEVQKALDLQQEINATKEQEDPQE